MQPLDCDDGVVVNSQTVPVTRVVVSCLLAAAVVRVRAAVAVVSAHTCPTSR